METVFIKTLNVQYTDIETIELPSWMIKEFNSEIINDGNEVIFIYGDSLTPMRSRKFFDYIIGLLDPETREETWKKIPINKWSQIPLAIEYYLIDQNKNNPKGMWNQTLKFVKDKLDQYVEETKLMNTLDKLQRMEKVTRSNMEKMRNVMANPNDPPPKYESLWFDDDMSDLE